MSFRNIVFLFLLFSFASCKRILYRVILDVRKPKYENILTLKKFLEQNQHDASDLISFNHKAYIEKVNTKKNSGMFANWELYNKDGYKIIPHPYTKTCYGNIYDFVKRINLAAPDTLYSIDSTKNIHNDSLLIHGLVSNDSMSYSLLPIESEFLIILYWSRFMGKYSRDILKIKNYVDTTNDAKLIKLLPINMDFRDYMNSKDFEIKSKITNK
jgi:hypothetical protein